MAIVIWQFLKNIDQKRNREPEERNMKKQEKYIYPDGLKKPWMTYQAKKNFIIKGDIGKPEIREPFMNCQIYIEEKLIKPLFCCFVLIF